jgi:HEAT repeat protein
LSPFRIRTHRLCAVPTTGPRWRVPDRARGYRPTMSSPAANDSESFEVVRARAIGDPGVYVRKAALRALADRWPDRPDTMTTLRHAMRTDPELSVRRDTVGTILSLRWQDETLAWLHELSASENVGDRQVAVEVFLAVAWSSEKERWPEALAALRARAFDDVPYIRWQALRELRHQARDTPENVAVFRDRATDPDPGVREVAISALGIGDPENVEVLYQRATTDEDEDVRKSALRRLSSGDGAWPDRAEAIAWLREHAASPDHVTPKDSAHHLGVPELATGLLVELWYGDPRVRAQVLDLLTRSRDDEIRCLVLNRLALTGARDPHTGEVVRRLVRHDPSTAVRLAAMDVFGWRETPETFAVLRERALAEPNAEIRAKALSRLWFDDGSRELLLRRMAEDPVAEVRVTLVRGLSRWGRYDPRAIAALGDRVRHDRHKQVRRLARKALLTLTRCDDEDA